MIAFSGSVTDNIELEFRNLYYRRPKIYPILYSVFGVLSLIIGIITLAPAGNIGEPIIGILILLSAIFLFVAAFRLQHIWWRWWWPKFLRLFGRRLNGEISERGIRFSTNGQTVEWKHLVAFKKSPTLVIIYFDKASAYPIHQKMINNSSEWQTLMALVKKNIRQI
ncbi:hypothetical protein [Candidatus Leptofilum sp.]|uniref:hypothetical protein n=1 Tax=Candidatus Leptofilum sp. TaxID=3241576 RepID=UPI003B59D820